jgi:hypothetical protein
MLRSVALLCALGLSVTLLGAQEDSDSQAQTYVVRGTVLNSLTHQPVARALVNAQEDAVLTDNDGRFEVNLPGGTAQFNVRRPGYNLRRSSIHIVQVGANMPELTFYLTPEAMITGQVTLSTSDAADGIRIMAYRKRFVNGRDQWTMEGMATTNSEGAYRIARLQPGTYLLYTEPSREQDGQAAAGATVYGYPSVYYPGVADMSAAGLLTLTPGQHGQADFALTREPFYSVTVAVPNREQSRGISFQVLDRSGRPLGLPVRWNAQQSTAQANVPNGSYLLETRTTGPAQSYGRGVFGQAQWYGRVEFTVASAPVTGLSMSILPLHSIPVTVRKVFTAQSNTSAEGQPGEDGSASAGLNLSLAPAEEFFGQGGANGLRPAGNDGSGFEIENVSPGRYWAEPTPFRGYVSSITSGGVDLAREPLVVGAGSTSAAIEITLRDDSGSITGQLTNALDSSASETNGQPASGEQQRVYIYAIPLFASAGQVGQTVVQNSGQFTISNLAPGPYRVVAFDSQQEIDFHTPQGLAKYAAMGQTVTVEASGTANVQLGLAQSSTAEAQP